MGCILESYQHTLPQAEQGFGLFAASHFFSPCPNPYGFA
ncbi:hypothetical protein BLL52_3259 [Rhodoferax antarcticus ANT.BR]|uniref:Uncharacterized protein n=1 Tax=Rhodoferax antarcticus ANT.BR TaxID=1111071 RepID=A0A1Q8YBX7_9BURK|nr:hypothetical protein BLL52_3259 [Rhodoferax antarcticus ANT.BR]